MSNERDVALIQKMLVYCRQSLQTMQEFGEDESVFLTSHTFQNATAMCIMQIGELAGRLSQESQAELSIIPWRSIRGMRNVLAHDYGSLNISMLWDTLKHDIPALQAACETYLQAH